MEAPLAADSFPRTFDLGLEAAYLGRSRRQTKTAGIVILAVLVAVAVTLAWLSPLADLALFPVFAIGAVAVYAALAQREVPALLGMTVGANGLSLHLGGGGSRSWAWNDPTLAFRVIDRSADDAASDDERRHLRIEFADGLTATITKSVLLALDDAAVEFRFPRLARREMEGSGRHRVVRHVVRFGTPTLTPHWAEATGLPPR